MAVSRWGVSGTVPADFLLRHRDALRPVLQPVIDLEANAVAGYEALARVGNGFPPLSPSQMFGWARRNDKTNELDWACRCAAFRTALEQGLAPPMPLFVNAEPSALDSSAPPSLLEDLQRARRQLRIVVELTERELADNPVQLFRVVDSMRALGWEIAVDDVGAEPISLALLPLLEPDVIKLDRALVVDPTAREHARTVLAVAAESERTGAVVIAEGIETVEQLEVARAIGARYAQGFLWGEPVAAARPTLPAAPLPTTRRESRPRLRIPRPRRLDGAEYSVAELAALIGILLAAAETEATGVVMARWPRDSVADGWRRELARLAGTSAFVGSATTDDRSCELVVLNPSTAAVLTARPADRHDYWEVAVSYTRAHAVERGHDLIRTVTRAGAVLSHQRVGWQEGIAAGRSSSAVSPPA
jgi:EAL domain-containing protein (putative c-di-GMP-specific phosphodiesterase class I)